MQYMYVGNNIHSSEDFCLGCSWYKLCYEIFFMIQLENGKNI